VILLVVFMKVEGDGREGGKEEGREEGRGNERTPAFI